MPDRKKRKIHPIHIEPEDEITNVIDRIQHHPSKNIFLFVPERLPIFQSILNFKLLRKTVPHDTAITIITKDPIVQRLALQQSISVKSSFEEEEDDEIIKSFNEHRAKTNYDKDNENVLPLAINWWGTPIPTKKEIEEIRTGQNKKNDLKDTCKNKESSITMFSPQEKHREKTKPETSGMYGNTDQDEKKLNAVKELNIIDLRSSEKKSPKFEQEKKYTFSKWLNDTIRAISPSRPSVFYSFLQKKTLLFLAFCLLIILIGLFLFIPQATITIYPKTEVFEQEFTIQALEGLDSVNYVTRQIPALFLETIIENSATKETTGEKFIGTKAKGRITVVNKRNRVTLATGTTLTAKKSGIKFVLSEDTIIPGAYVDELGVTRVNKKVNVPVEAVIAGPEGNIPPDDFSISGQNENLIWGESNQSFAGGTSKKIRVVSTQDQQTLLEEVKAKSISEAHDALLAKLPQGYTIPTETIETTISEEKWSALVGEEAQKISLSLRATTTGIAINQANINDIMMRSFEEDIPKSYETIEKSNQTWYKVSNVNKPLRSLTFSAGIKTLLLPSFSINNVREALAFQPLSSVESILLQQIRTDFLAPPTVTVWPTAILERLPLLPTNIKLEIKEQ